jgi:glycosyltransferase involved in cell wall biosynthesis
LNLLLVIPYTPSLIRTRSFTFVRSLARRGHQVTLAALWESEEDLEVQRQLRQEGVNVLTARLTRRQAAGNLLRTAASARPLQAGYSWSAELLQKIEAHLSTGPATDAIHLEHLRGVGYGVALQARGTGREGRRRPMIWDSVDCISLLFERIAPSRSPLKRWIARIELPRTRRWEGRMVGRFSHVLATSPDDARELSRLARQADPDRAVEVEVLPNGVDLGYFEAWHGERLPATLLMTGKMSYHANATAAVHLIQDIMPRVWSVAPEVEVILAGKAPPREVRRLAEDRPGRVQVTGTVPDLRPFLRQATAAVVPLVYGAGSQYKVLEAMASATPVVVSPQATPALETRDGKDLLIADGPQAFADSVLRLLHDAPLRHRLAENGRRYVERHHDWEHLTSRLETLYAGG